jgi:hypothetical protein
MLSVNIRNDNTRANIIINPIEVRAYYYNKDKCGVESNK